VPLGVLVMLDDEGALYLLSESNLFYRFERGQPTPWAVRQPPASRRDGGAPVPLAGGGHLGR
jgi:hypothetical protein